MPWWFGTAALLVAFLSDRHDSASLSAPPKAVAASRVAPLQALELAARPRPDLASEVAMVNPGTCPSAPTVSASGIAEVPTAVEALSTEAIAAQCQQFSGAEFATDHAKLLLRAWCSRDPDAAIPWWGGISDAAVRAELAPVVAVAWAEQDPEAALRYFQDSPDPEVRLNALVDLGLELARENPLAALQVGLELPASPAVMNLRVHALAQWAAADAAAAQAWALELPAGEFRQEALAAVAVAIADAQPSEAAGLVASGLAAGELQDRAALGVLQRWAQIDFPGALSWVSHFAPSAFRDNAVLILAATDMSPVAR